ncbi:hypothetical protein [Seleniivibrio woodruffii]|uniref:hypothetical protein n=1 Tax=Seleniivibrio woodruffii TaxID=1078050 RepID=UPI0026F0F24D|nr:hypothetical protein [Seleniivibrio woodruffii]
MLVIDVLLLFFLVNGFYIYPPLNSSLIVPFLVVFLAFFSRGVLLNEFSSIIKNRYLTRIVSAIIFLFSTSLLIPILHQTYDFSYAVDFISQSIQLVCISSFACLMLYHASIIGVKPSEYVEILIIKIFLLQSFIQIFAFVFSDFADFVHIFYKPEVVEYMYERYGGGVRGLALTGSPGWGLAVGYGLAFLFFFKHELIGKVIGVSFCIKLFLLILGAFFSGRSAFVGLLLAIAFYIFSKDTFLKKIGNLFKAIILATLITTMAWVLFPTFIEQLVLKVFPFVFEFYFNYQNHGELSTNSTDVLINMWQINIPDLTYIFGDGFFTDKYTGLYYKNTDVGYLRNILFGGFFWTACMIGYQFLLQGLNSYSFEKHTRYFLFTLFIFTLFLEFKAMTLGYNKYMFTIIVLYVLSLSYDEKRIN